MSAGRGTSGTGLAPDSVRALRREDRRARQREEVLAAARVVIRRDGVAGFTTAAVAAEAGIGKASLFYYFSTKEELMGELVARLLSAEADDLVATLEAAPDGLSALEAFFRRIISRYATDLDTWRVLYLWSQVVGAPPELLRTRVYPISARVNLALEVRLRSDPRLHPEVDARRLANVAWFTAHGLLSIVSSLALAGGDTRYPVASLTDEAVGVLLRGASRPG